MIFFFFLYTQNKIQSHFEHEFLRQGSPPVQDLAVLYIFTCHYFQSLRGNLHGNMLLSTWSEH